MGDFRIKRGYDIPISGKAETTLVDSVTMDRVGVKPVEIQGLKPRLLINVGDRVAIGDPLVEHKDNPRIVLVSPGGGQVVAVNRGARRSLEEIIVQVDSDQEAAREFPSFSQEEIQTDLDRKRVIDFLLRGGMWPLLRQRPFVKLADPDDVPQSIFVTAVETEPLLADPFFLLEDRKEEFEAGLEAISKLTDGPVHLCLPGRHTSKADWLFTQERALIHTFSGPHPSGCVGTHIHLVEPIKRARVIWTIKAIDVAHIGRFLLEGGLPVERKVALAGMGAKNRKYYKTRLGAPVKSLLGGGLGEGDQRIISGGVLTGKRVDSKGFLGFFDTTVTVIPEGGKRSFLGWLYPGFDRSSFSNAFASSFAPRNEFHFDTSLNGEPRAFVPIGSYESVVALDVQPTFLFKAIVYGDLEEAEKLGLLECAEEDVALCSYVCHSKIDFCSLLREALNRYEKEG